MGKISLANKYRPLVFEDIVEQDSIKQVLMNQMSTNNLKHVYLFCGRCWYSVRLQLPE